MRWSWRLGLASLAIVTAGVGVWALGFGTRSRGDPPPLDSGSADAPHDLVDLHATDGQHGEAGSRSPRLTPATQRRAMPQGTGTIRGRAVLTSGQPASGASVRLRPTGSLVWTTVRTDADGHFVFRGLIDAHHLVEATLEVGGVEHGSDGWFLTGVEDAVLTLPRRTGILVIVVVDPEGAPVPSYRARLVRGRNERPLDGTSDHPGVLRVKFSVLEDRRALLAGAWIEVWDAHDAAGRGLALAPRRVGPLVGDEREISVRLDPGPAVAGRVVGPDGPVADVAVTLTAQAVLIEPSSEAAGAPSDTKPGGEPDALAPFEGIEHSSRTGTDGSFCLAVSRPEANQQISARPPRGFLRPPVTRVPAGQSTVTIHVESGARARIAVMDPSGAPVTGALVSVSYGEGEPSAELGLEARRDWLGGQGLDFDITAEDGVATLRSLVPRAACELHVLAPDRSRQRAILNERKLQEWMPEDTTVVLPWVFSVSGEVRDADDRPVPHLLLRLEGEAYGESDYTDDLGRFTFEKVPSGKASIVRGDVGVSFEGQEGTDREAAWGELVRLDIDVTQHTRGLRLRLLRARWMTLFLPHAPSAMGDGTTHLPARLWLQEGDGWASMDGGYLTSGSHTGARGFGARVTGLDPQSVYRIWTHPMDGTYVEQTFRAEGGTVLLTPQVGGTIQGRVRGLPARRAAAIVMEDEEGRSVGPVLTDADGRFEVRGLPEATWDVDAWCETDGHIRLYARAIVRTGDSVDMTLEVHDAEDDGGLVEEQEVVLPDPEPTPRPNPR